MGKTGQVGAAGARAAARASGGAGAAARPPADFTGHERLTPKQVAAVTQYQEGSHVQINDLLRGRRPDALSSVKDLIPHLDRAIDRSRINKAMVLYRGVTVPGRPDPADLVGMRPTDPGFLSTSTKRSVAEKFVGSLEQGVLYRIEVPAGTKGLAVHRVATGTRYAAGGSDPEHEVLLPRGTTLRIKAARRLKSGQIVVGAELLP